MHIKACFYVFQKKVSVHMKMCATQKPHDADAWAWNRPLLYGGVGIIATYTTWFILFCMFVLANPIFILRPPSRQTLGRRRREPIIGPQLNAFKATVLHGFDWFVSCFSDQNIVFCTGAPSPAFHESSKRVRQYRTWVRSWTPLQTAPVFSCKDK